MPTVGCMFSSSLNRLGVYQNAGQRPYFNQQQRPRAAAYQASTEEGVEPSYDGEQANYSELQVTESSLADFSTFITSTKMNVR